ncbi:hypothetical protein IKE71_03545 [Candidatus Saccharibacteria bacterium]|nr:hypothetical protein [Candidatus Saccharibacteria bacterium]
MKMKLEHVQVALNGLVNGTEVDSFAGVNALLARIPGVKACGIDSGATALMAGLFENGGSHVTLAVTYPWTEGVDYKIGIRLGKKTVPFAYGMFSDFVAGLSA